MSVCVTDTLVLTQTRRHMLLAGYPWRVDLLADVLAVSGVRGSLGARIEAAQSWGVRWVEDADAVLYAITAGTAWLILTGEEPVQLMPGDVVLLPTGVAHGLCDEPAATMHPCDLAAAEAAREEGATLRLGCGDVRTHILGASYRHDPTASTQVLALLPEVVHIRADNGGSCLDDTVRLLARELAHPQIATAVVLDRLVDILLIHVLRVWLMNTPQPAHASWLGALGDPLTTDAMTRLHREPARPWTTDVLAAEMAVSRSTLSRRFATVVGQSPGAYLTQWRMDVAARRLRDTDDPLEVIAHSVGYTSVYAFNRAFSRARSQPPGRYRLMSRTTPGTPLTQAQGTRQSRALTSSAT